MIDTIGLNSPPLSDKLLNFISGKLIHRTAIDANKGETLYYLTSASLPGSFSHGVSIQIIDLYETKIIKNETGSEPLRFSIGRGIRVESSLNKALLGHNVYGGTCDLQTGIAWYISFIEKLLHLKKGTLPNWKDWRVYRVDIAKIYYFPNPQGISEFINSLVQAKFPRASIDSYGSHGLTVKGRRDLTPKIYHKGPEFKKHDFKVLSKSKIEYNKLNELQSYANHILRCEVEIKRRILKEKFSDGKNLPKVTELTYDKLLPFWEETMSKLIKERATDMKTIRNVHDVQSRLLKIYGPRMARSLMSTWYSLSTIGEELTMSNMAYSTYRKHINHLINAGISWKGSNVGILDNTSLIPTGFSIFNDIYEIKGESIRTKRLLKKLRKAS